MSDYEIGSKFAMEMVILAKKTDTCCLHRLKIYCYLMMKLTLFIPHHRVEVGAPEKAYVYIFTIKYLCQMAVLKKQGWYKYLLGHIIGRIYVLGKI